MTKKQKQPPAVDLDFDEALARFAQTDPGEMADAGEAPDGGEVQLPKATHQGSMQVGGLDLAATSQRTGAGSSTSAGWPRRSE